MCYNKLIFITIKSRRKWWKRKKISTEERGNLFDDGLKDKRLTMDDGRWTIDKIKR